MTSEYVIRTAARSVALEFALKQVAELSGSDARQNIEAVRDQAINTFKNAEVPAHRDLDHVTIVRPAIEMLVTVFESSLEDLPTG